MDDTTKENVRALRAKAEHARQILRMVTDAQTRANIASYLTDLEAQF